MKIWVIGRGYPTTSNKMWGSFEFEQAKLLARNGHDVSYISLTLSFFDRKDPRGYRNFIEDNVNVHAYSHFYFPGKFGIYWEKFEDKCWAKILGKAQEVSGLPDVIHVHYPSMISSIREIEKYRNKNVVCASGRRNINLNHTEDRETEQPSEKGISSFHRN